MPTPNLHTRRPQAQSSNSQSSLASSTSSAASNRQTSQSSVQNTHWTSPSTPTSLTLQRTSTIRLIEARHPALPPPAVPFYPDIRRRLRYRNNALALGIAGQKSHLLKRLLLYCPRLSNDLCFILCTCQNVLEPDNPWLLTYWETLTNTDTNSAVNYVPSPDHRHTWVMTTGGLKEAAEVLQAIMKHDMPNSIHEQLRAAAHTLAQIYQGLQAEIRLYSGRYGAGRELHIKWEIHWNKNEQEEREWKEVKYQEILKNREDVQTGRRHVMQTTGMTEEEIVQRAKTPSRKRRRSILSIVVPSIEVGEQPVDAILPMRTYYQRPGFANRSGVAADWLSEVPIVIRTTSAPTEVLQIPQTPTNSIAFIETGSWVSADDAARAAAIMYSRQQALGAPRMPFAQWVQFAHSLRRVSTGGGPLPSLPQTNRDQLHMNMWTHAPAPSQRVHNSRREAVETNGQPQVTEFNNGTAHQLEQQLDGLSPLQIWSPVPSADAAGRSALERLENGLSLIEGSPMSSVESLATVASTAPNSAIPSERRRLRARAVSLVNRGTTRRTGNERPSLVRNRNVEIPDWAMPGSQARADDTAIRARNAAAHNDQGAYVTNFYFAIDSNIVDRDAEQDGRAGPAALIRAADTRDQFSGTNSAQQDQTSAHQTLTRQRNSALHNIQRAHSTGPADVVPLSTLASPEEQTGTASPAVDATNTVWQPWSSAIPQPSLPISDDSSVRGSDIVLLARYRAVLAEEEQEMRFGGRSLLERRADRWRSSNRRAPPRVLDVVGQQDRARRDTSVARRSQTAGVGSLVFSSNISSETDEDAFWWQGSH